MSDLRTAAQQALEALERGQHTLTQISEYQWESRGELAMGALKAALAEPQIDPVDEYRKGFIAGQIDMRDREQAEPVQAPVAWAGHDLDAMADAFSRVIEAHHSSRHPFHNPLDMDARMALRILRGVIPAMKATTAPPQRKPLTEDEIALIVADCSASAHRHDDFSFARAIERAHGIGGGND